MRILLSNDDGVYAPGLTVLYNILKTIAHVDVVAPDRNRSGVSSSLTLDNPLRVKTVEKGYVSVEGTPTDCIHLALTGLLDTKPDMVIAGINAGPNLGDDVLYSGTVAAAMEGRSLGYPAIAISLVGEQLNHFDTAAHVAKNLILHIYQQQQPFPKTVLNVNVPDIPLALIEGQQVTRLGTRYPAEPIIQSTDPRGQAIYWVGPPGAAQDASAGSDFHAIRHNNVSITPLLIDFTHYSAINELSAGLLKEVETVGDIAS